jgi:hypothetical protein
LLYAVAAAPLVVEGLYDAAGQPASKSMTVPSGILLTAAALGLAIAGPLRDLQPDAYEASRERLYPVQAVSFIDREQLQGPIWNDINWGAWLIGIEPRLPVFVDARTEIYGDTFLYRYKAVADGVVAPQQVLDDRDINLALIEPNSPMATELRQDARWREPYRDRLASVFVRDGP